MLKETELINSEMAQKFILPAFHGVGKLSSWSYA